jgi:hypothetical protein
MREIGWIDYRMHEEGKIVILLSTHAELVPAEGEQLFVWMKFGGKKEKVHTGPMHL